MVEYFELMWELVIADDVRGYYFFICLYCALLLSYSFLGQLMIRQWPSVCGALTSIGLKQFGFIDNANSKQVKTSVSYTYTVDSKEYVGVRLSPWVFITNINASALLKWHLSKVNIDNNRVSIFYKLSNPSKSYLLLPSKIGLVFTATIAYLPLALYIYHYHLDELLY